MRPDEVSNVVVLGDVMVGKTSIVHRMCSGFYEPEYTAAAEADVFVHSVTYGKNTRYFRIFDVAEGARIFPLAELAHPTSEIVIFVYDCSRVHNSMKFVRFAYEQLSKARRSPHSPFGLYPILVGAKSDLLQGNKDAVKEAEVFARQHKMAHIVTSAESDHRIQDIVGAMLQCQSRAQESVSPHIASSHHGRGAALLSTFRRLANLPLRIVHPVDQFHELL